MVRVDGCDSANVTWTPSRDMLCDLTRIDHRVRYKRSDANNYSSIITPDASVTLQGLTPNAQYDVQVAAMDTNGKLSTYSTVEQLNITGNS